MNRKQPENDFKKKDGFSAIGGM